jgi:hypothetical protein
MAGRAGRQRLEAMAAEWVTRERSKVVDDYLHLALGAFKVKRLKADDPELVQRAQLCEVKRNSLRLLVDELATPAKPEFKALDEAELKANFHLECDPYAPKPGSLAKVARSRSEGGRASDKAAAAASSSSSAAAASSSAGAAAAAAAAAGRKRARAGSMDGGELEEESAAAQAAHQNFQQSRLEQVLTETADRLLRTRLGNHFKGQGYPYDNPFAVRLERNGGIVPEEYFDVVAVPCDLSKVSDGIKIGEYKTLAAFEKDIRLIVDNSRKFHKAKALVMYKVTSLFEKEAQKALQQAQEKLKRAD